MGGYSQLVGHVLSSAVRQTVGRPGLVGRAQQPVGGTCGAVGGPRRATGRPCGAAWGDGGPRGAIDGSGPCGAEVDYGVGAGPSLESVLGPTLESVLRADTGVSLGTDAGVGLEADTRIGAKADSGVGLKANSGIDAGSRGDMSDHDDFNYSILPLSVSPFPLTRLDQPHQVPTTTQY